MDGEAPRFRDNHRVARVTGDPTGRRRLGRRRPLRRGARRAGHTVPRCRRADAVRCRGVARSVHLREGALMHEGAYRFVADTVRQLEPRRCVIELGSRTVAGDWPFSGPVRPLFGDAAYVGVDIADGPNVDLVADAAHWPVPGLAWLGTGWMQHFVSDGVDTVVCCETLEHTPDAEAICRNAHRMLMTGGVFLVTAAGDGRGEHSAVDGGPLRDGEFYRNVDRYHLETWLEMFHFRMIDTATPGDIYAIAVK